MLLSLDHLRSSANDLNNTRCETSLVLPAFPPPIYLLTVFLPAVQQVTLILLRSSEPLTQILYCRLIIEMLSRRFDW